MSNLRQAAQQALEVLENSRSLEPVDVDWVKGKRKAVIATLRAALAEEALQRLTDVSQEIEVALAEPEQEPVAWMTHSNDLLPLFHRTERAALMWGAEPTPLYTAPPQRKPLTDEELEVLWDDATDRMEHFCSQYWDFARAIEQAHGIKGEA